MSYIITGVKRQSKYDGSKSNTGQRNQQLKSRAASVDQIDQFGNGAASVATYAPVIMHLVDEPSADLIYCGTAAPGSDPAQPIWRIKRITIVGTLTITEWAYLPDKDETDKIAGFDHIWNNRAALTYK
jgi:hypothetical protein